MASAQKDSNVLKAYFLLLFVISWTVFSLMLYCILTIIPFYDQRTYIPFYHRVLCRLMGVKIILKGNMSTHLPTLFVSNHVSYLDIPVLGSLINAGFVAKSEIANWPFINVLARIQNTIFIERKASKAKAQIAIIRERLNDNYSLILFPEGTSTNGAEVLPLKSSLFSAAEPMDIDKKIYIQPISVVYAQHNDSGMDQDVRDHFAWYADFPFGSHFFKMLSKGSITAVITFNEPVLFSDFSSRKDCANACEQVMRTSFEKAFTESGSTKS